MSGLASRLDALDWADLGEQLEQCSYALTPPLLDAEDCHQLAALYRQDRAFRKTVVMARHGYGRGEYRYFTRPLPDQVAQLRSSLYPPLARIANQWAERLGGPAHWPGRHQELLQRCREAGQPEPTPLLLRYGPGDYNCLHQDLYGPVHFPLQAIVLLDRPGIDFEGGELTLVEQRPRRQSRCEVVPLTQGRIAIIPVRERPRQGSRGSYRAQLRHGVSSLRWGCRHSLGIIFHDAA